MSIYSDITREEFYKILNYMLLMQVITMNEYTNLEMKTLPYLK